MSQSFRLEKDLWVYRGGLGIGAMKQSNEWEWGMGNAVGLRFEAQIDALITLYVPTSL